MYYKAYTFFLSIMFCFSCADYTYKNPTGYDLTKPVISKMANELNEISGISFFNGNPDTFYAINDEEGKLYYFNLNEKKPASVKFGKGGDYEDVSISTNTTTVLKSNGELYQFTLNNANKDVQNVTVLKKVVPANEYEGLYAGTSDQLYVLCKNCSADDAQKAVSIYHLVKDSTHNYISDTIYHIDVTAIGALANEKKMRFQPSALAKHPVTGEWFILSSVNKLLVIADDNFFVKEAYKLPASLFRQPEGLAFDKDGNMYISNEAKDKTADIMLFKYNR